MLAISGCKRLPKRTVFPKIRFCAGIMNIFSKWLLELFLYASPTFLTSPLLSSAIPPILLDYSILYTPQNTAELEKRAQKRPICVRIVGKTTKRAQKRQFCGEKRVKTTKRAQKRQFCGEKRVKTAKRAQNRRICVRNAGKTTKRTQKRQFCG